jgi:large repetitive protein
MRFARMLVLVAAVALVVVPAAWALRFTDDSFNVPVGTVGVPYSHTFKADGGNGPPYTFTLQGGSLPPGLSLSSGGVVSGTPTQAGSWTFGVYLTDYSGGCAGCGCIARNNCAWREFTINILAGLTISNSPPAAATVGTAYSVDLNADGGGTQTWSLASGALPPGLSLDAGSGVIAGTPGQTGRFDFSIRVSDGTRSNTKAFTISVSNALAVTSFKVPQAEVGMEKPFELKLAATGGNGTNTWTLAGTLPQGLQFAPPVAPATEATITGTPTAAGSFTVKVTVADTDGRTQSVDVPIVVASKLAFVTKRFPLLKAGKLLSVKLRTAGGAGTTVFKVTSGKFPPGVRMDRSSGTISGTAKKGGTYRFAVEATDALGVKASQTLVLTVKEPAKKKHS